MKNQKSILIVAAHPDDEVLGCGGTIARFANEGRSVHVLLMADGEGSRVAAKEQFLGESLIVLRNAAAQAACKIMGCASVDHLNLPDNRLDGLELLDVVKQIENFIERYQPSTVFTHHAGDVNIDHRIVHEAVLAACRPQPECSVQELLFFEVPSSTEWSPPGSATPFLPNFFVDISATLKIKIAAMKAYENELRAFPHPRSLVAIDALAKWRGATVGVEAAEAFILGRKLL
ncbi:MAG: GlcNAc-PI de-N-acetylase [Deltaproteobacteria bacterium CG_4_10_14_0_2_um_filter_43_8]|nr:MAG: GlcNAc-PI de-N-acetylase [Deltaproteobacteria bacterium CG11_big_fil_rev_8_21_14_0_20_42_23]PJA21968.1 MAG: GlcNAc-PI de-N-acetylase [Deltaproteobacteria bacterium CG_4_10_14_0_2_um_filter_43_8]PJC64548.1 MAG: GlcNAc-PI de-N-acetylase [Deltaproteobacteria bacterium CG_4_9_14_0_2_um_filter_42_21]